MKQAFTNFFLLIAAIWLCNEAVSAADWSFNCSEGPSYVYFDNSQTQWSNTNLYLIIGKSSYSSVYPMSLDAADTTKYFASFPTSGWEDAEYMAVIGNSNWEKGNYGYEQLKNAKYYTGKYEAGISVTSKQKYSLTPQSQANGANINLNWVSNNFEITFFDNDKNNCQRLDAKNGLVTIIFSTSNKRFNTPSSEIASIYMKGSVSNWSDNDGSYRLGPWSTDGCMFRVFRVSDFQRLGNSGCPEFVFHVVKKDDSEYDVRSHSSWEGGIDSRLVFINNGENMVVMLPGDDIAELGQRKDFAQYIAPLSDFSNLSDSATIAHLTNFRRVPGTKHLYRSYHPYKGDRPHYDTEHERLVQLAKLGEQYGIQCDIALSGNQESHDGEQYECGGKNYTFSIPPYYQDIIDNNRVLYVGTQNGQIPDYNTAVFNTNGERFAEWMQEVIRFINDEDHPAPFQIHCSLGADRTGAFCATLAALCGATWEQIAIDYENTSNLRIQEYRHRNCVRYELRLLTGEDPETCTNLSEKVAQHFITGGYLTQEEINKAVKKLKGETTTDLADPTNERMIIKEIRNNQLIIRVGDTEYNANGTKL